MSNPFTQQSEYYPRSEESELLQENQENYNSFNLQPAYQPFNQRFIVRQNRTSAKKQKKFDYAQVPNSREYDYPNTYTSQGKNFKMDFYQKSKDTTNKMREKVMKMIQEKNQHIERQKGVKKEIGKPPAKPKTRNSHRDIANTSFINKSYQS